MAQMKRTAIKGTAKNMAAKPSTIQQIAKRFNITAREARDIATAVSTATQYRKSVNQGSYSDLKKDVVTQIKEVGRAAVTGKKGTAPLQKYQGVLTRKPGSKSSYN
jgi:hypothetical protein